MRTVATVVWLRSQREDTDEESGRGVSGSMGGMEDRTDDVRYEQRPDEPTSRPIAPRRVEQAQAPSIPLCRAAMARKDKDGEKGANAHSPLTCQR